MKKTGLLFLVLAFTIYAQVVGTTKPGRLVPKKISDLNAPVINITEPKLVEGTDYKISEDIITIKGTVTDETEVAQFTINDITVQLSSNGNFTFPNSLRPGANNFIMRATDKFNNIAQRVYRIIFEEKFNPPSLVITEPVIIEGQEYAQREPSLTVRGRVKSDYGSADVFINKTKAEVLTTGDFFASIPLQEGVNNIVVKAIDKKNITADKMLKVTYRNDNEGPIVTILEPGVTRGSVYISKSETQLLRGIATDKSGIKEVVVNEVRAKLNTEGEFTINVGLNPGDNRIIIKAVDNYSNISIDTFYITRKMEELIAEGKYYGLIIGIDKYRGAWQPLRNAVNDAKSIEDILKKEYKFDDVISLYDDNATRNNILAKLEQLSNTIGKDDNVLIFYSGHGEFKSQFNKGYWVPFDATTKSVVDYISNSDLQTFLKGIPSKHTLLISDACFSGDIFRGRTEETPFEDSEKYYKEVYKKMSRAALTSGGIEPVADGGREGHSVFTYFLLKTLKDNRAKYFTAGQVFKEIEIPVTNNSEQTPVYNPIKNTDDAGGQFIFIRK